MKNENEKNPPEKIMHGADKFIGALIVNPFADFPSHFYAASGAQSLADLLSFPRLLRLFL